MKIGFKVTDAKAAWILGERIDELEELIASDKRDYWNLECHEWRAKISQLERELHQFVYHTRA